VKNNFVDIFVLNWNQKNLSLKCIESLTKLTYKNNRIFFIDNGSTDGSHIAVKDQFPTVNILRSKKNLGYSKGNNFGFNAVKKHSEYSIFLNNDTTVDPSFIEPLIAQLENDKDTILVAPKIFYAQSEDIIWFAGGRVNLLFASISHYGIRSKNIKKFNSVRKIGYATGCCFGVRSLDFSEIGMFNEEFSMYGEDVDLSLNAKRNGGSIYFIPNSMVWHHVSSSLGGRFSFAKWKKKTFGIFKLIKLHISPLILPIPMVFLFVNSFFSLIVFSILRIFTKDD